MANHLHIFLRNSVFALLSIVIVVTACPNGYTSDRLIIPISLINYDNTSSAKQIIQMRDIVYYDIDGYPISVIGDDFNNDNFTDLVVANYFENKVSFFKNRGNGAFEDLINYNTGVYPRCIVGIDLNNDNYSDLIVGNGNDEIPSENKISILWNDTCGNFNDTSSIMVEGRPRSIFSADFDCINGNDIATCCNDDIFIYLNKGDGSFHDAIIYDVDGSPTSIHGADLDNDSDIDLAVGCVKSYVISVFRNNGDGTFEAPEEYSMNYGCEFCNSSIYCVDLNNDNWCDIASSVDTNLFIYINDTSDSFHSVEHYYTPVSGGLTGYELNGDDYIDIIMLGGVYLITFPNKGDGTLNPFIADTLLEEGSWLHISSIYCADYDNDGDNDLAITIVDATGINDALAIIFNYLPALYVSNDNKGFMSNEFSLKGNYPNPFNPTTIIDYYLPTRSQITISVYNLLGQRVRTLFDGEKTYGPHSIIWDGTDQGGRAVATGIYFYQIKAGEFVESKKMLLLK